MTPADGAAPGPGPIAIGLRIALIVACVVAATWAAHMIRDALHLTLTPENERQVHRAIMLGLIAYVVFLAAPFVPGAEIGVALLTAFGAAIAPLVYVATVFAMLLAYGIGQLLPVALLVRLLAFLRLRRAADLVARAAPLPRDERLALLLQGAPPRTLALALRHRYLALALVVNMPGNAVIGGGGGIMMMAGLSGIFAPLPTLVTVIVAVAPVPLTVLLLGG
jgi:hypothetical protein